MHDRPDPASCAGEEEGAPPRGFADGDPTLWRRVVEENQGWMFVLAIRMVHHRQDAEDAVQEAFVRAWRSRDRLREFAALRGWLRTTLVRQCIRRPVRPGGPSWETVENWLPASSATRPDRLAEDRQRLMNVLEAMNGLPLRQRTCLILSVFEGMNGPEIAEQLELSAGTVRRYLHDARRALEPVLEESLAREARGGEGA
jgi:RNA polymerase sigma-70 factor (ECF subfamily)